jgi:hypothetical protein
MWWCEPRLGTKAVYPRLVAIFSPADQKSLEDHVKIEFPDCMPLVITPKPDKAFRTRLEELVECLICVHYDGYENCYSVRDYLVCVAEECGHEKLIRILQNQLVASTKRFWQQREYRLVFGGTRSAPVVSAPELVVLSSGEEAPRRKKTKNPPPPRPNAGALVETKARIWGDTEEDQGCDGASSAASRVRNCAAYTCTCGESSGTWPWRPERESGGVDTRGEGDERKDEGAKRDPEKEEPCPTGRGTCSEKDEEGRDVAASTACETSCFTGDVRLFTWPLSKWPRYVISGRCSRRSGSTACQRTCTSYGRRCMDGQLGQCALHPCGAG